MEKSKNVKEGTIVIIMDLNEGGVCDIQANTTVETQLYFTTCVSQFLAQEYRILSQIEQS